MKTFTVSMAVWHGSYKHEETRTAGSVCDALLEICKTPMGIGYAPKIGSDQFNELDSLLSLKGKHTWGWGNYTLTIHDAKP